MAGTRSGLDPRSGTDARSGTAAARSDTAADLPEGAPARLPIPLPRPAAPGSASPDPLLEIDRVRLGGADVDLCTRETAVAAVHGSLRDPAGRPLLVASANLDHLHHFAAGRPAAAALADPSWLVLLDGMPLVWAARRLTGRPWEQLAGSDLLPTVLGSAVATGARVGFLGGRTPMHDRLRGVLARDFPDLEVAGMWAPERAELTGPDLGGHLADAVRAADVDLLVVGLGKPLQERWLVRHAAAAGVRVGLAFGASADFLAGEVDRAPERVRRSGLEWGYRLAREPRRLARRYLVQGPPAAYALARRSAVGPDAGRR